MNNIYLIVFPIIALAAGVGGVIYFSETANKDIYNLNNTTPSTNLNNNWPLGGGKKTKKVKIVKKVKTRHKKY